MAAVKVCHLSLRFKSRLYNYGRWYRYALVRVGLGSSFGLGLLVESELGSRVSYSLLCLKGTDGWRRYCERSCGTVPMFALQFHD